MQHKTHECVLGGGGQRKSSKGAEKEGVASSQSLPSRSCCRCWFQTVAEEGKMLPLFRQREHRVHRPRGSGIHDGSVKQKGGLPD